MIDITGLNKKDVFEVLYRGSHQQGYGFLHRDNLSREELDEIYDDSDGKYFDYVSGRIMKVDLSGDEFDERLYDRDNGSGAAYDALYEAGLIK